MAQGVLAFKYQEQRQSGGMTALAGLPVYLDLAQGCRGRYKSTCQCGQTAVGGLTLR